MTSPQRSLETFARRMVQGAATRIKPAVPPGAQPALRVAASMAGNGPLLGLPGHTRLLVFAPHPDDETIGCGGTLALLAKAGAAVKIVVATDGGASLGSGLSPKELGRVRQDEARAACAILGIPPPTFLGLPDGGLADVRALGHILAGLADFRPDAVYAPWFGDNHPDHIALGRAALDAAEAAGAPLWAYEVWAPLPANRIVDITAVAAVKHDALTQHASAHAGFVPTALLALNRYRSVFGLGGNGEAEAFLAGRPDQHREWGRMGTRAS